MTAAPRPAPPCSRRPTAAFAAALVAAHLVGALAAPALAQGLTAHVLAGAAVTTFSSEAGTAFDPGAALSGGFGAGYDFGNGFSLHAEVLYVLRTATADGTLLDVPTRVRFQYTDVEVPVLAVYRLPLRTRVVPLVLGGGGFAWNRDARLRYRAGDGGPTFDEVDDAAAGRVPQLVVGLGAEVPFGTDRAFVHARLHAARGDIREQASDLRTRTVLLVAGVRF